MAVAERNATDQQQLEERIADERKEAAYQHEQGRDEAAQEHESEAAELERKLAGLKTEAGESTSKDDPAAEAAAAAARDAAAEQIAPEEIIVRGVEMDYAELGGKKPTGASVTLTGAKALLEVGTALQKGTTIRFAGIAVVSEVKQKDKVDPETQQVTDAKQVHTARVLDFEIEVPE